MPLMPTAEFCESRTDSSTAFIVLKLETLLPIWNFIAYIVKTWGLSNCVRKVYFAWIVLFFLHICDPWQCFRILKFLNCKLAFCKLCVCSTYCTHEWCVCLYFARHYADRVCPDWAPQQGDAPHASAHQNPKGRTSHTGATQKMVCVHRAAVFQLLCCVCLVAGGGCMHV